MRVVICASEDIEKGFIRPLHTSQLTEQQAELVVRQVAATFRQLLSDRPWREAFPTMLSVRAENILRRHKAETVGDVAQLMLGIYEYKLGGRVPAGMGMKSIAEIRQALAAVV